MSKCNLCFWRAPVRNYSQTVCRVIVAKSGDKSSMGVGEIVGILEDRYVNDPVYDSVAASTPSCSRGGGAADATDRTDGVGVGVVGGVGVMDASLQTGSMVRCLYLEHCYLFIL